jgi:hypothetical protein
MTISSYPIKLFNPEAPLRKKTIGSLFLARIRCNKKASW